MDRRKRKSKHTIRRARQRKSGLTPRSLAARNRVLRALRTMRYGATISRAARENGVSVRTIQRYAGRALVQNRPGGRIRAAKSDRLLRYLQIPGPNGARDIKVRGSRLASEFAKYKAATNRYLSGDRHALADWHGKKIGGIELITDEKTLKELAQDGKLPYGLYRSFSGGAL